MSPVDGFLMSLDTLGYEGGYDAVRRYARTWLKARGAATAEAYIPLYYAPGEAYQFDWSHDVVLIAGVTVTVKVAHIRLCHSRMMFVRAYMRESQEMVFDAHDRAFAFFRGTLHAGHLRQHEDGGRGSLRRQGAALQPALPADVQPLPRPADRLHPRVGRSSPQGSDNAKHCWKAAEGGRRVRWRTRSALFGSGSSRRGCE